MEVHHFASLADHQSHHLYFRQHNSLVAAAAERIATDAHRSGGAVPAAQQQHVPPSSSFSSYFPADSTTFAPVEQLYAMGAAEQHPTGCCPGWAGVGGTQPAVLPHCSVKSEFNNNNNSIALDEYTKYGGIEFLITDSSCGIDFVKDDVAPLKRFANSSPPITSPSSSSTSTLFDSPGGAHSSAASTAANSAPPHQLLLSQQHQHQQQYSMISHKNSVENGGVEDHAMSSHVAASAAYAPHQSQPEPSSSSSASTVSPTTLNNSGFLTFVADRKRPYPCNICPSKFGSKMELEEHQNSHTGMKPFQCDICQSRFNRRSTLWNHKRIHSDAKPFICTVCQMTFKWKNSLKCHKEMHYRKNEASNVLDNDIRQLTYATAAKKQMTDANGVVFDEGAAAATNITSTALTALPQSRKPSSLCHPQQQQQQQQLNPLSSRHRHRETISHVKTETNAAVEEPATMSEICLRNNDAQLTTKRTTTTPTTSASARIQQKSMRSLTKGSDDRMSSIYHHHHQQQQQHLLFNNNKRISADGQNVAGALSRKSNDLPMDATQPLQMSNNNRISMEFVHHTTLACDGTTKDALARLHDTIDAYAIAEAENRVPNSNNVTVTPTRDNNLRSTQHFMSSGPALFSMSTRQSHELTLFQQQQHRQDDNGCDKLSGVYFEERQSCCPTITQTDTSSASNVGRLTAPSHRPGHHHHNETTHQQHSVVHALSTERHQEDTGGFNFSHSDTFFNGYPMPRSALLPAAVSASQPLHPHRDNNIGGHPLAMIMSGDGGAELLVGCNNNDFYYTTEPTITNPIVPLTSENVLNNPYANNY